MNIIAPNTPDDIAEVLGYCSISTRITAKTLFPDIFWTEFSTLHDQIFDLIDSDEQKIAIAAPRGIGKTTIATALAAKEILFRQEHFIAYVMNSATVACMQTENLKHILLTTPTIRHFFGNIKKDIATDESIPLDSSSDETFAKSVWTAFGTTCVLPRGAGQQIRGLNWRSHRPGLILVDDLENKKEIMSEENRKKIKSWFFSDLVKSVDRYSNKWKIVYIDTLKHEDSLLQELLDSPDWASVTLSICTDDLETNAPEYMTTEEVKKEYKEHERKGLLDEFYSEFMNMPVSLADQSVTKEHFRYYKESEKEFQEEIRNRIENILIVDPAKTAKLQSADSALICIGLDLLAGRYFVREVISEKFYPDELYDEIFRLTTLFKISVVGIEVTSLHEFIVQPIKNEMYTRSTFFELIELKAVGDKVERFKHTIPYYRRGYIYHEESLKEGKLESQILSFPKPKLWDCIDCMSYLPKMLELGQRYFSYSGSDLDDEDEIAEQEYQILEESYEPTLTDWRCA
jgi:phage terminase large subunit-like protein